MSRNTNEPRYFDYYGMMSYADFLANLAAGTLAAYVISNSEER